VPVGLTRAFSHFPPLSGSGLRGRGDESIELRVTVVAVVAVHGTEQGLFSGGLFPNFRRPRIKTAHRRRWLGAGQLAGTSGTVLIEAAGTGTGGIKGQGTGLAFHFVRGGNRTS
jgi:hypothetical protein